MVERLTLTARVEQEDARFVARIICTGDGGIDVRGEGESPDSAREELIQAMLSWISSQDCAESMAGALAAAGFEGLTTENIENTEIILVFP